MAENKKGRGENAPTFLIITFSPVPVHPWSMASGDAAIASGRSFPALISNADDGYIGGHCVQNKMLATKSAASRPSHVDDAAKAATKPASPEGWGRRRPVAHRSKAGRLWPSDRGRVSEWFKEPVLKTGVRETVPWVRIPPLPPMATNRLPF